MGSEAKSLGQTRTMVCQHSWEINHTGAGSIGGAPTWGGLICAKCRKLHPTDKTATKQAEADAANAREAVNHPAHYNAHPSGVECITVVEHFPFNIGNAIKYLWRADHKNGLEDLRKAAWYVQREIERLERGEASG